MRIGIVRFCLALAMLMEFVPLFGATSSEITEITAQEVAKDVSDMLAPANKQRDNLISIPLIPHHVHKRRRRRRHLQDDSINYNNRDERHYNSQYLRDSSRQMDAVSSSSNSRQLESLRMGPLYLGYGTHYVDLWCGTPPQRQTLIVDTGSAVAGFPCDGCSDCGELEHHVDDLFRYKNSATFYKYQCNECPTGRCENDECRISRSYREGSSWKAFEASDVCYMGGPHGQAVSSTALSQQQQTTQLQDQLDPLTAPLLNFPMNFGCQTTITGLFKTQLADGILGMDKQPSALWKQLYDNGKMDSEQFAMCFSISPHVDRDGTEAGAMTLGGADVRLHKTPMVYAIDARSMNAIYTTTGSTDKMKYFNVRIRKVYMREGGAGNLESAQAGNPNRKVYQLDIKEETLTQQNSMVDSGTTDTYLSSHIRLEFMKIFKMITGEDYSHRSKLLTPEEIDALPTILLQLDGYIDMNKNVAQSFAGSADSYNNVLGLAGDFDSEHPYDVILAIPPRHYMEYDEEIGKHVARIYLNEASTVLGANAMMGHDVLFDPTKEAIGFAESDCSYTNLLTQNGYDASAVKNVPYDMQNHNLSQQQQQHQQHQQQEELGQSVNQEEKQSLSQGEGST